MIEEEGSIVIERPVGVVFDFLLDGENNILWRKTVTDIKRVAGRPNTYKQGMKGPGGRADGDYEVTEVRPNESISIRTIAGLVRPTASFKVEPVGQDTRVTYSLRFDGKGPARLMEPIVATIMKSEIGMLENLKSCLEGRAQ